MGNDSKNSDSGGLGAVGAVFLGAILLATAPFTWLGSKWYVKLGGWLSTLVAALFCFLWFLHDANIAKFPSTHPVSFDWKIMLVACGVCYVVSLFAAIVHAWQDSYGDGLSRKERKELKMAKQKDEVENFYSDFIVSKGFRTHKYNDLSLDIWAKQEDKVYAYYEKQGKTRTW